MYFDFVGYGYVDDCCLCGGCFGGCFWFGVVWYFVVDGVFFCFLFCGFVGDYFVGGFG